MKTPERYINRRKFIQGAAAIGTTFLVAGSGLGTKIIDNKLENAFENQRKWTLEYIQSPKYRERLKRALARGFFKKPAPGIQKDFNSLEEVEAFKKAKLETLYPSHIDTSLVSDEIVNEIIKKRLENVKNAKMGIVNSVSKDFFSADDSIIFGSSVYREEKEAVDSDLYEGYSTDAQTKIAKGKNILLSRMGYLLSSNKTTTPA